MALLIWRVQNLLAHGGALLSSEEEMVTICFAMDTVIGNTH